MKAIHGGQNQLQSVDLWTPFQYHPGSYYGTLLFQNIGYQVNQFISVVFHILKYRRDGMNTSLIRK